MTPKAFLSLAAEDTDFVSRVYRHLPHGQAFFFKQSFANGALMLDVMEREVGSSQLFVLFASKTSVQKTWVKFELERARLAQISGAQKRLQVYPADPNVSASDLPKWMQDFWFDNKARTPRDIARIISKELNSLAPAVLTNQMYGRGALQDALRRRFNAARRDLGGMTNPNIILASGLEQIGRETVLRETLPLLFPAIPQIGYGPTLDLPVWADIKDLYRAIREQVEDEFDLKRFEEDLEFFDRLDESQQIDELTKSFGHFQTIGQAVIIRAPSFIYDRTGRLKSWVQKWFNSVSKLNSLVLGIVTNRQVPAEDQHSIGNACHITVGSIADEDVKLLIDDLSSELRLQPHNPPQDLFIQIGGHPALARAYVRLCEQYGTQIFDRSPHKLFSIQDGILHDNLDPTLLDDFQKTILHVLSWLPKLDSFSLAQICLNDESQLGAFSESLNDLILGCLVEAKGNALSISGAVRAIFRRRFGYGSNALLDRMHDILSKRIDEANAAKAVTTELIDGVIFMYALTGKAMPAQFRKLLLPSTLERLVRDAYNSGREDPASYDRAIAWGAAAEHMKMDDSVREEILGCVVRAHIRKENFGQADILLEVFEKRNYRSRFFLRGFRNMKDGKLREAIPDLVAATKERRYRASAVNQLGIAYFRIGHNARLQELLKSEGPSVERSAFLLDLRAQLFTAENNYVEAEKDIQLLARLPEDNGRSRKRRAIILAKRDRNLKEAIALLTSLIDSEKGRAIPLRFLRGLLAAKNGDRPTAISEADFVRANSGKSGEKQYQRILASLALAERNWKATIDALDRLHEEHMPDRFVRAEALKLKAEDATIGLAERDDARKEALNILAHSKTYSDLDFAGDD